MSLALPSSSALRPFEIAQIDVVAERGAGDPARGCSTTSTTSGSGLFQPESERTPISAPQPTLASGAVLVKTSASGPIATSRYCDHRPSSISAALSFAASVAARDDRADAAADPRLEPVADRRPPRRCRRAPRSSITRSIAETAKVTPAALTPADRRARATVRVQVRQLLDAEQPLALDRERDRRNSSRSAIVGAARETSSTAPGESSTGVGPSSSANVPRAPHRRRRQAASRAARLA